MAPMAMTRSLLLALAVAFAAHVQLVAQPAPRLLVMPFDNVTGDSRILWMGEAAAVLLVDDLNALGIAAITREERREAFERLQVPPAARLTDATAIRLGQLVGATHVVLGTMSLEGDVLVARGRTIALDSARVQRDAVDRGPIADLFTTFERMARRLAPVPPPDTELPPSAPASIVAFENYIKGLMAGTPNTAIHYLTLALQTQPTFDRARLALWDIYAEQDAYDRALVAVQPVSAGSPWYRRARFLAGLAQLHLKKYDEAFGIFKGLADDNPTAAVLNNLGVVQMRRPVTPQAGEPTYYFNKAAETDKGEADYFFNLGYAYWLKRETKAAIYWLREAVRRDPTDGDAHFVLGAALAAAGSPREANREKELARRLSSTYAEWEQRPPAEVVPRGLERVRTAIESVARPLDDGSMTASQREQRDLARPYVERARRLYEQESDGAALAELNRALFLSPYLAEAHLLAGRIHLRGGHVTEAIEALKISLWSAETAEAHAVLADAYLSSKDAASARGEAERALALDPSSSLARQVLDKAR